MYKRYPSGELTLWCNARNEETVGRKRKRDRDEAGLPGRYQKREDEVDDIIIQTVERKAPRDSYDVTKLRLWARMMASNLHSSLDEPQLFMDHRKKKKKKSQYFMEQQLLSQRP